MVELESRVSYVVKKRLPGDRMTDVMKMLGITVMNVYILR